MSERKITLVRHGRPTVSLSEWITGRSLCHFIDRYNRAGIHYRSRPPAESLIAVIGAERVFTSDFRRTIESAQRLQLEDHVPDPQFREVDCWMNFPWPLPTPVWVWLLLTRVLWPLNLVRAAESYPQAQERAAQGADVLITAGQAHQHVILVGHGGINTLISRELRLRGWQGLKQPRLSHWAATTYTQPRDRCL